MGLALLGSWCEEKWEKILLDPWQTGENGFEEIKRKRKFLKSLKWFSYVLSIISLISFICYWTISIVKALKA